MVQAVEVMKEEEVGEGEMETEEMVYKVKRIVEEGNNKDNTLEMEDMAK